MRHYLVKITAPLPYPVARDYREEASRMAVAVKRAIDKYRKDANGKRIKELSIKATRL
jgi:hypothetical protein